MIRKILFALAGILVLIQFFRIDKSAPPVDATQDFRNVARPSAAVLAIMEPACYDCHSYETRYPWYAEIAPVSWWLKNHLNEAREHLNFSTFGQLSDPDQLHAFEEMVETIEEGEMPLSSYTWPHADARLTDAQRAELMRWIKGLNAVGMQMSAD